MARLSHPHVVQIFDLVEASGETGDWIVMEYVQGRSLADLLRERGALPAGVAVELRPPGGRGSGRRSRPGAGPSRSQGRERDGDAGRPGQDPRLRPRPPPGIRHRRDAHRRGAGGGDLALDVPRAGRRGSGGRPLGPLLPGRAALRDAGRPFAVPGEDPRRDPAQRGRGALRAAGPRPAGAGGARPVAAGEGAGPASGER